MRIGAYLFQRCRPRTALAFASAYLAVWVWNIAPLAVGAEKPKTTGSFEIPAWAFDRGSNVVTCTSGYADAEAMVGNLRYPTGIEYDIELPTRLSAIPACLQRWFPRGLPAGADKPHRAAPRTQKGAGLKFRGSSGSLLAKTS